VKKTCLIFSLLVFTAGLFLSVLADGNDAVAPALNVQTADEIRKPPMQSVFYLMQRVG